VNSLSIGVWTNLAVIGKHRFSIHILDFLNQWLGIIIYKLDLLWCLKVRLVNWKITKTGPDPN